MFSRLFMINPATVQLVFGQYRFVPLRFTVMIAMLVLICHQAAYASDVRESTSFQQAQQAVIFDTHRWDWIQLNSGEWLKGRIKMLYNRSLDINSDHFGVITVNWDDIAFIHTSHRLSVLLEGGEVLRGALSTRNGTLWVDEHAVPFEQVVSVASGSRSERDLWSANIAFGMNIRSGNVDQTDLNTRVSAERREVRYHSRLSYSGNYSESDDIKVANNHRAQLTHDYRVSHKWFLRPLQAEYYRDPFQNRAAEWTLGFGAGYQILDTPKQEWSVSAGPAYLRTEFVDVGPGEDRTRNTPAFLLGTVYSYDLTNNMDVNVDYQVTLTETSAGKARHNFYAALDVDLTQRLDLRIAGGWKRIERPQPDSDGLTPEKDDFTVIIGLAMDI